ncbi:MAG: 30S ribosomal protein S17 [Alphaproteobacteria bacterium]|nr:30S ribosomal protein S17 [Alphaproteobacteria bacterium]MDA7982568.1 30S ribosomal protein S17 [Alphaproteobacteria bacterium]MDA7983962.1 30S ribosomal protein S17 [Alphaproteobacteria bacterium]MDA7986956.1 30S ribosomal protein S17 [Alphaproteobacteria bacterium]MDA7988113.1 30S ribosomal protein S17 [Alphaproteobacteria bacterium]
MPARRLQGVVVSNRGDKTAVVLVERRVRHPRQQKFIRRSKRYHAHDENNACQMGDKVVIREIPPRSKLKTWEVVEREGGSS